MRKIPQELMDQAVKQIKLVLWFPDILNRNFPLIITYKVAINKWSRVSFAFFWDIKLARHLCCKA